MLVPEHEKLHVYKVAVVAAGKVERVARAVPASRLALRDQLRRASTSVVLNLAEGASEYGRPEKARFYRMARRSAAETMADLDLLPEVLDSPPSTTEAKEDLLRVLGMLTTMIHGLSGPRSR